ncbi:hypothetical protein G4B88_004762 [Cannabis sativa]|uniref:Succinate dehydrogenase subunit 3 n=1 Tax=Cannabis sativa TaxID=3483 RepID=A0A7J6FWA1_CANSA|nr:hypothetical protein G4B88_004762 [Cannabis sativa]
MALRALLAKKNPGFRVSDPSQSPSLWNLQLSRFTDLAPFRQRQSPSPGRRSFQQLNFLEESYSSSCELNELQEAGGEVKAEGAAFQGSGLAYKSFCRTYSTSSAAISNNDEKTTRNVLRPLSPHLPVYQPQLSSMLSIFNRISGSYLTALVLFNYLSVKIGWVSFTSAYFYQFMFYSSKLFPISVEIAALALSYHVIIGIQHLVKRA